MKVVVIGGGALGLSCAWQLVRGGATVELLEAERVGWTGGGATGAALGALWPADPAAMGPLQQMHREALRMFPGFVESLERTSGLSAGYARTGRVELLVKKVTADRAWRQVEEVRALGEAGEIDGLPFLEAISEAEFRKRFPDVNVDAEIVGGEGFFGAIGCRLTARVDAQSLLAALRGACLNGGVVIREGVRADGFIQEAGKVRGVQTAARVIEADAVLVAAGAWSEQLVPGIRVKPVKGQGIVVRKPADFPVEQILKAATFYMIPSGDELLIGATREPEARFDAGATRAAKEELLSRAVALVPALKGAEVIRQLSGLRPDAPKHTPVMGPVPGVAGLWVCAGHYKIGMGLSPRVAELIAQGILEELPPALLGPFLPKG